MVAVLETARLSPTECALSPTASVPAIFVGDVGTFDIAQRPQAVAQTFERRPCRFFRRLRECAATCPGYFAGVPSVLVGTRLRIFYCAFSRSVTQEIPYHQSRRHFQT